jgi:hypothetical protein
MRVHPSLQTVAGSDPKPLNALAMHRKAVLVTYIETSRHDMTDCN